MIVEAILSALVPVGIEGIKQFIANKTGAIKATTVEEQIRLDQNEIERIKAIAALDSPGGSPSQWVVDLRASARYIGALSVIAVGIGSLFLSNLDKSVQTVALEAANIAFGFLFGSRIAINMRK
jgi:hypothetical protein